MGMDPRESLQHQLRPLGLHRTEVLVDALLLEFGNETQHASVVLARAHALSLAPVEGRRGDLVWQVCHGDADRAPQVDLRWGLHRLTFDAPENASALDMVRAFERRLGDKNEPMAFSAIADHVSRLTPAQHTGLFHDLAMAAEEARAAHADAIRLQDHGPWQAWLTGASRAGHEAAVLACIGMGASVRMPDVNGNTPLHHAARFGHAHLVTPLVESGADVSTLNGQGWAPLHLASLHKHARVCLQLMAHGANPEQPGWRGRTPTRMHQHQHLHEQAQAL